jgi:hypothetical protein
MTRHRCLFLLVVVAVSLLFLVPAAAAAAPSFPSPSASTAHAAHPLDADKVEPDAVAAAVNNELTSTALPSASLDLKLRSSAPPWLIDAAQWTTGVAQSTAVEPRMTALLMHRQTGAAPPTELHHAASPPAARPPRRTTNFAVRPQAHRCPPSLTLTDGGCMALDIQLTWSGRELTPLKQPELHPRGGRSDFLTPRRRHVPLRLFTSPPPSSLPLAQNSSRGELSDSFRRTVQSSSVKGTQVPSTPRRTRTPSSLTDSSATAADLPQ